MSIKVLIADDTTLFREGIKSLFGNNGHIVIVGEAANGFDAAEQAVVTEPDVVLLDYDMPGLECLDAIRLIKDRRPSTEIIVLAEDAQHDRALRLVEAGASGYVLKDIDPGSLARAIVDVCNGCTLMNPRVARDLVEQFRVLARERKGQDGGHFGGLTGRETQILMELAKGATDREIAHKMSVTTTTVKSHIRSIFRKIGVKNRTQAAVRMIKSGIAH
jgi:DNA-binding NarL/FixJ family response regulator